MKSIDHMYVILIILSLTANTVLVFEVRCNVDWELVVVGRGKGER